MTENERDRAATRARLIAEQFARVIRQTGIADPTVQSHYGANGTEAALWFAYPPPSDMPDMPVPSDACCIITDDRGHRSMIAAHRDPRADALMQAVDSLCAWAIRVGRVELDPAELVAGFDPSEAGTVARILGR